MHAGYISFSGQLFLFSAITARLLLSYTSPETNEGTQRGS